MSTAYESVWEMVQDPNLSANEAVTAALFYPNEVRQHASFDLWSLEAPVFLRNYDELLRLVWWVRAERMARALWRWPHWLLGFLHDLVVHHLTVFCWLRNLPFPHAVSWHQWLNAQPAQSPVVNTSTEYRYAAIRLQEAFDDVAFFGDTGRASRGRIIVALQDAHCASQNEKTPELAAAAALALAQAAEKAGGKPGSAGPVLVSASFKA